ncbi:MAG: pyridoxal phosphate-dependent aminotransferase [Pseudomonadota bacterium]
MLRFELEDFFDTYEHRPGLINLASSDALPWPAEQLRDDPEINAGVGIGTLAYPDVRGLLLPGLRELCAPPPGADVLPTSGAAEAIALVLHEHWQSCKTGRTCLLGVPAPGYGAFRGLASLLGMPLEVYGYEPTRQWAPDSDELLTLARRCSALVVNNPHNPTGHVLSGGLLEAVALEMAARDALLIVDEVFRLPQDTPSAIELGRASACQHVVVIGSLSKVYGLPGLRLGWVVAERDRLSRLRTLQQYFTLTLGAFTVQLGAAVLQRPERFSRAELIRTNRQMLVERVSAASGRMAISPPLGGTTVCLSIESTLSEDDLFDRCLQAGVLLAPGARCFDAGHQMRWFRLGYGGASDDLDRGLRRIDQVIAR